MILEPVVCDCKCPDGAIVFGAETRCDLCKHLVRIELTDVSWNEPDLFLDSKSHRPIKVKDVQQSSRHEE